MQGFVVLLFFTKCPLSASTLPSPPEFSMCFSHSCGAHCVPELYAHMGLGNLESERIFLLMNSKQLDTFFFFIIRKVVIVTTKTYCLIQIGQIVFEKSFRMPVSVSWY